LPQANQPLLFVFEAFVLFVVAILLYAERFPPENRGQDRIITAPPRPFAPPLDIFGQMIIYLLDAMRIKDYILVK